MTLPLTPTRREDREGTAWRSLPVMRIDAAVPVVTNTVRVDCTTAGARRVANAPYPPAANATVSPPVISFKERELNVVTSVVDHL